MNEGLFEVLKMWGLIILMVCFVLSMFVVAVDTTTKEVTQVISNKDCFDNFNNKINGVTCTEEITCGVITRWLEKERCYGGKK